MRNNWFNQLIKEWLLLASAIGLIATSIYLKRLPLYSFHDIEILYILFTLFIIIKGIENSYFFMLIASLIQKGKAVPLKLTIATFVLSMFVTNDVALLIVVPLTLHLSIDKKDILIILEVLAANSGSAFTPFGNPQNLFIYWFYHLNPLEFIKAIAPLVIIFFFLLSISSLLIKTKRQKSTREPITISKQSYLYLAFLLVFILAILGFIPLITGFLITGYVLIFNRNNLKIDYILLLTFFCFFGFTDNLMAIINVTIENSEHVFLFSALLSQFMSNVPAALLFSDFTHNWKPLLWGVNVGGFGNLIGSLANLIAYRLYLTHKSASKYFFLKFHIIGYTAFFVGCIAYFLAR